MVVGYHDSDNSADDDHNNNGLMELLNLIINVRTKAVASATRVVMR